MVQDPVCQMKFSPREARTTTEYEGKLYYFCSLACRDTFISQPDLYLNNVTSMFLTVGVMGSAGNEAAKDVIEKSRNLGKHIAQRGFVLITGACPGLPYECASGAKQTGGMSIGISPALSLDEHIHKYKSPVDVYDVIIYTGSGLMGREVTNIRSSDMVIILGGRSGTLGEFAIAFDEGKLIGVLQGSGGITDQIPDIVASFQKDSGARLVYSNDPVELINEMAKLYTEHHYQRPSCFCDAMPAGTG